MSQLAAPRPRIAVALEYPLMQQGGTEVLVQALIRTLAGRFEIVLVSGDEHVHDLPPELAKCVDAHLHWRSAEPTVAEARRLARALHEERIEFAHFHFGGTYMWSSNKVWTCPVFHLARMGVPCIATNHLAMEWLNCGCDPARPAWQKALIQVRAWLSRLLVYRVLRLEVTVSRHDRKRVQRMFPMFRRKIIQIYHSLLSADAPSPPLEGREPVILCVGTIGGRKAQPVLVDAFAQIAARHPKWELEFIGRPGTPGDAELLREKIRLYGLEKRVHLRGKLTDAETERRMKAASIFAMPSLQEGLGLALQEALFHGCVGVGSRAGGIPELIDHESNGLLAAPGDPGALAAALERLLSDPGFRERCRAQARPSIIRKGMISAVMFEQYLKLYRQFLPLSQQPAESL